MPDGYPIIFSHTPTRLKSVFFVAKIYRYKVFVAKIYKYGILVAKFCKCPLFESFVRFSATMDQYDTNLSTKDIDYINQIRYYYILENIENKGDTRQIHNQDFNTR